MKTNKIKKIVKEGYARIAKKESSCCGTAKTCGDIAMPKSISKQIGYSDNEINTVPEGANLGLGCGNPVALASLKEGETVLDLGAGAGFDCFLAANKVGKSGKVIGIDMTLEMVEKARKNARKGNYKNVEFKLGEIENIPVPDSSVDIIISNCVINLSPDKPSVFKEAFRVLKPGGRLMVSDIVLVKELPGYIKKSIEAYVGCLGGAIMKEQYIKEIKSAGFQDVKILNETFFPVKCMANDQTVKALIDKMEIPAENLQDIENSVLSIKVSGIKPV